MKVKRQPLDWEKIFANHAIDKGLVSLVVKFVETVDLEGSKLCHC